MENSFLSLIFVVGNTLERFQSRLDQAERRHNQGGDMTARWIPLVILSALCAGLANVGTYLTGNLSDPVHVFLGAFVAAAALSLLTQFVPDLRPVQMQLIFISGLSTALISHFGLGAVGAQGNIVPTLLTWAVASAIISTVVDVTAREMGIQPAA